jgi:CHAT domain-containing protein
MTNLARALLLAGARSTVTAAWDVDDRAAEILMVDFHRRLAAGTEAAEALRGAQEAALSGGKYRHPGFWAGFALHGAGGRVTSPDRR